MSGPRIKKKKILKNTRSNSKKLRQSSQIDGEKSKKTSPLAKNFEKSQSDFPQNNGLSLWPIKKAKKSELPLSAQGNLQKGKENCWDGYDLDSLPTLTEEQCKSFRTVTSEEYIRLCKPGRPRKLKSEKENTITIRFSDNFLNAIKLAAKNRKKPWQTFIKEIIAKEIDYK